MRESFKNDIMEEYQEYLPNDEKEECRDTAVYLAFRFAIPADEVANICRIISGADGKMEIATNEFFSAYRFYLSKPFQPAIDHILEKKELPLMEARYGLRSEKQRTRTRIRNTKQGESFKKEQLNRIELIDRHLKMVAEELNYLHEERRKEFQKKMRAGCKFLAE